MASVAARLRTAQYWHRVMKIGAGNRSQPYSQIKTFGSDASACRSKL